jgi:uncharacterized protein YacL
VLTRLVTHTVFAAVLAVVATVLLRELAVAVFDISEDFEELAVRAVITSTIGGVVGAGVAAAIVAKVARDPVRVYLIVVVVALVVSLPPPLTVDGETGARLAMAAMHVVTAAICAGVLTRAIRPARDPATG